MCKQAPEGFPLDTLATQRALTALFMEKPDKFIDTLTEIYRTLWIDRQPIQKPEAAIPCFAKACGISEAEAKALYQKGNSPDVKSLLKKNTDLAFHDGAFGIPWFVGEPCRPAPSTAH
jgi:2-hydroxychromene-2-carboxylate isomerase